MASKYVPPSEDGRFEHRKMKDMDISSDDEKLPIDDDGNVDWVKYYQKNTPQIDEEEFEKLKKDGKGKKSPFTPEYDDTPFLNDNDIYNKINDDGNLEFIDSEKDSREFEKFEEEVDPDFIFDEEEIDEEEEEEENLEEYIYNKSSPGEGDAFLIIIEEDDEVDDKIIFTHEIREKDIIFKDEDEK